MSLQTSTIVPSTNTKQTFSTLLYAGYLTSIIAFGIYMLVSMPLITLTTFACFLIAAYSFINTEPPKPHPTTPQ